MRGEENDIDDFLSETARVDPNERLTIQASYERLLAILDIKEAIAENEPYSDPDLTATAESIWNEDVYMAEAEAIIECFQSVIEDEELNYSRCLQKFYFQELQQLTDKQLEDKTELLPRGLNAVLD